MSIGLLCADVFAGNALYTMMSYLTDVWELNLTQAAAVVNIWSGATKVLIIPLVFVADAVLGNHCLVLISNMAYATGLGILSMSTPPVLSKYTDTCKEYQRNCIGHTQQRLFYLGLSLTAIGIAGNRASLNAFVLEQYGYNSMAIQISLLFLVSLFNNTIRFGMVQFAKLSWSLQFGIPAISMLAAILIFVCCSPFYKKRELKGSRLTTVLRVLTASTFNISIDVPGVKSQLYKADEFNENDITERLRFLEKAAIIGSSNRVGGRIRKWRVCSVKEVEEAKAIIKSCFHSWNFLLIGMVSSTGNTYFQNQANHLNRKLGKITIPLFWFLQYYDVGKMLTLTYFAWCYMFFRLPRVGTVLAMILSTLCCITAAKVESRRLRVVAENGLIDSPFDRIPMTVWWLLPQFVLLGSVDAFCQWSNWFHHAKKIKRSFGSELDDVDDIDINTLDYQDHLNEAVSGIATMATVLVVYIIGKINQAGGRSNWFQQTLNTSHLDHYYWMLAAGSATSLVLYIFMVIIRLIWRS